MVVVVPWEVDWPLLGVSICTTTTTTAVSVLSACTPAEACTVHGEIGAGSLFQHLIRAFPAPIN